MDTNKIVNELKKIPKNTYYTFFSAGSATNLIKPGGDLDLFFVIRESRKNEFFKSALRVLGDLKRADKKLEYSLYRGPIKLNGKKLIHFLVYTKKEFFEMRQPVIKSCLETGRVVSGIQLKKLLGNFNFDRIDIDQKALEEKWAKTIKEGKSRHTEWVRVGNSWKIVHTTVKLDNFQMRYWRNYVLKFKSKS